MEHDVNPKADMWTPEGVSWAARHFIDDDQKHMPKRNGYLTREQLNIIRHTLRGFEPGERGIQQNLLKAELQGDVMPFTWTMSGHLWAMQNAVFEGPPPSVHSWVTRRQLRTIEAFQGTAIPQSIEGKCSTKGASQTECDDCCEMAMGAADDLAYFRKQPTEEGTEGYGRPKPFEDNEQARINADFGIHAMPEGVEVFYGDDID